MTDLDHRLSPHVLTYLSPEIRNRHAFRDFALDRRPRRPSFDIHSMATYYFRAKGLLGPTDRWTTNIETEVGNDRFKLLAQHFGYGFAAEFHRRRTMTRDAFRLWSTNYIEPADEDILRRLKTDSDARSAEADAAELRDFRDMRLYVEGQNFKRRRAEFVKFLRDGRRGECNPERAYRAWRGVEEDWMRWTRPDGEYQLDPNKPPSKHYRIKPDIERVLGPKAVPLIFKAPRTTREELAAQIEELP